MAASRNGIRVAILLSGTAGALWGICSVNGTFGSNGAPQLALSIVEGATPYDREIRPLLAKYCHTCHGSKKTKGELNLEAIADEKAVLASRKVWKRALEQLSEGNMPPDDKPQPTPDEKKKLLAWLSATMDRIDAAAPPDPGRVVLRRLNKVEYTNTVRDLIGVDFKPAEGFPSDDVGYGFDNIGDVLSLPPLLLEKYLAAARKVLDRAIETENPAKPVERRFEAEAMQHTQGGTADSDMLVLFANGEVFGQIDFPIEGEYVVKVRAGADRAGNEAAKMALRLDGQDMRTYDVTTSRNNAKTYEMRTTIKAGRRRVAVGFINDYYNPQAPNARERDRNLIVDYIEVFGPVDAKRPDPPETHRRIFTATPAEGKTKQHACREIVAAFAPRAFRRPVSPEEVERFAKLFDLADRNGESFEQAMKVPLQAVLVSPHFLFRVETDKPAADANGIAPLGGFELASRISYFLWSSMPDAELLDLAAKGALADPKILDAQVDRMLKDPRARSLGETFAAQWLEIRRLETVTPDRKLFPSYDPALRDAMHQEAVHFFNEVVRENRSVVDLLAADFTFLNERLARHYGIADVKGPEMRRVALKDPRRGGILTMAAVLTVNSNPTRTSPTLRGKWVLDAVLGTPPPPPPPEAGELAEERKGEEGKITLRQRLERHRKDPLCASCHRRMDPIGFGFENYDGTGSWRDKEAGKAVDASATLVDGRSFNGAAELRAILVGRKDEFARAFTARIFTYALGRGVEYDERPVKSTALALQKDGYRIGTLVKEVVRSYAFRNRRNRIEVKK